MDSLWLALLTGITIGGFSCLAVQGGFLASSLAQKDDAKRSLQIIIFLAAKLVAYTLLGAALGLVGASLSFSPKLLGWMQITAGLFMLLTAARLLELHPVFRYFVIQPPRFTYKLLKGTSQDKSLFAPATLGFLTLLIPCGVTQAMMLLAASSGNMLSGAGIMLAFTLGTSPVFFVLGFATLQLLKKRAFVYLAAFLIAFLGISAINTGQVLRGSVHTLSNYYKAGTGQLDMAPGQIAIIDSQGKQEINVSVQNNGFTPSVKTLKAGIPVKLNLITNNVSSCTRTFVIPSLNLSKVLPQTGTEIVEFTPTKTGLLTYSCGMGMYTGQFTVVN